MLQIGRSRAQLTPFFPALQSYCTTGVYKVSAIPGF
ncbi:hypothetical protein ABH999_000783 [Bradyrhizobium yuanmingense]